MPVVLRRIAPFVLVAALVACNNSSSGPTDPSTPPPAVTLTSVTIGGSGSGTVGQTSQLTATAGFSDGSSQVVTDQTTWETSNTSVATVSSAGRVTFAAVGEADIKATYKTVSAAKHVSVSAVAKAQFKLTGLVMDASTGKNVVGATVAVTDGPDAGRSVQSDGNGRYAFDALTEGTFTIKVTHPGYTDLTRQVTLASDLSLDLAISAVLDLSSNYGTFAVSLTLVSDTCEFPPGPGSSGTIKLSGSADGSVFSFVITERGTTRTYSGSMDPDGSFSGKGSGLFAGSIPLDRLVRHDFTGRVTGRVSGRNIDGSENVTFGDPCPGRTLELSFSGSK